MAAPSPTLVYRHATMHVATGRECGFTDLTDDLACRVEEAGIITGLLNLHVLHTTAAIVINEHEPLLLDDFDGVLERVAPRHDAYRHDSAHRLAALPPGEHENGHAHCRTLLLGPSACLNVANGRLVLGRWQRVFLVEQDGPRCREISLLLMGEAR